MDPLTLFLIYTGVNLISGGVDFFGNRKQEKKAEAYKEQGGTLKESAMGSMDKLLADRRQSYQNIFDMVYGGVRGNTPSPFGGVTPGRNITSGGNGYGFNPTYSGSTDQQIGGLTPPKGKTL